MVIGACCLLTVVCVLAAGETSRRGLDDRGAGADAGDPARTAVA
jgi:hypothetical protein